jgi:hypothetical protein
MFYGPEHCVDFINMQKEQKQWARDYYGPQLDTEDLAEFAIKIKQQLNKF